ncbi:FecR family protein [Mucilaginibacter gracilis]|uniref:FecR family protein n=1 Tax=Mucilaginibacter gracilis TaxID=423350 RepID=A0A495J8U1_9SPHI|nr:FecR family protein [Mucilaginibacter gracilis]RKR85101.1 FecR family protein [Mucilaginibacter gracilis]
MKETTTRLQYLLTQYANNACSRAELLELLQTIEQGGHDKALQATMDTILADLKPHDPIPAIDKEKIFRSIIKPAAVVSFYKRVWFKASVAAAIIIMVIGVRWFQNNEPKQQAASAVGVLFKNDVAPGGNKATLTLANGQSISLTEAQKGQIAKQGASIITKTTDGQIVYNASSVLQNNDKGDINLIKTPKGGKWDVTLSDGTKVWLNASSSIKYPSAFMGNERKVEITGEAYFEVAHNAAKPFRVIAGGQTVEVLGTHFNINAYNDEEAVKTTLLQGKVKITNGGRMAILMPGQQAATRFSNNSILVKEADTELAVAWHNGYFQFEQSDIHNVMKQLSRWYDVDVKFDGKVTRDKFGGSIPRDAPLSQVLRTLEQSMVHFKIDGKTVTVME